MFGFVSGRKSRKGSCVGILSKVRASKTRYDARRKGHQLTGRSHVHVICLKSELTAWLVLRPSFQIAASHLTGRCSATCVDWPIASERLPYEKSPNDPPSSSVQWPGLDNAGPKIAQKLPVATLRSHSGNWLHEKRQSSLSSFKNFFFSSQVSVLLAVLACDLEAASAPGNDAV